MNVKNLTRFAFGTKVTSRRPPQVEMTLVVRGAFVVEPGAPLSPAGEPGDLLAQGPMGTETYREEDEERTGEALTPDDFADFKLRADLLLRGTCHAPGGRPVTECPVAFRVGDFEKTLRVVGRRVWSDSLAGAAASDPLPFTKMPVDYAHAFGGPGFAKNPFGKGIGAELPNVENPRETVRSRKDRPEPAGFGPLSPEWPQRKDKRGKDYGAKWKKTRAPFYSEDFDWSFFNAAPPDQQIEGYLRGDEDVRFHNLHPEAPVLVTRLPGLRVRAFVKDTALRFREVVLRLDTLFADLDQGKLFLTWRGLDAVLSDDLADVSTLLLVDEPLSEKPLSQAHYQELLEAFEKDPQGLETHKPKGLPDRDAELAQARAKLAQLAESKEISKKGGADAADPLTGIMAPLLALMPSEQAKALSPHLAKGGEGLAKAPAPGRGGAAPDLRAMVREASALPPIAPAATPAPVLPPEGQSVVRNMLKTLEEARANLAKQGRELPKELDSALSGPMGSLLGEPAAEGPKPPPGPGVDLRERDFSGQDLRGADLRGADLSRANLSGARLDGALLSGAKLEKTLLNEASLQGADFSAATLDTALFTKADAREAIFRDAVVDRTVFLETDLRGACFDGAKGQMAVFQNANLAGASAKKARLEQSAFLASEVTGAEFSGAVLFRCLFAQASAQGARFEGASLDKTSFVECDLTRAIFLEARGHTTGFLRCTLREADLRHATFRCSHFTESDGTGAGFFAANLRESRFYRSVLTNADLSRANLFFADFGKALLSGTRFNGASLFGAKFLQASGAGADFHGANLSRSTLETA